MVAVVDVVAVVAVVAVVDVVAVVAVVDVVDVVDTSERLFTDDLFWIAERVERYKQIVLGDTLELGRLLTKMQESSAVEIGPFVSDLFSLAFPFFSFSFRFSSSSGLGRQTFYSAINKTNAKPRKAPEKT